MLAADPQLADGTSTRRTARDARAALLGRYQLRPERHGRAWAPARRREAEPGCKARLPAVPQDRVRATRYGGQRGHMLELVEGASCSSTGFTDAGDLRRRPQGDHHLHPQGDGGRRAGGRASSGPSGLKGLHVAVASVRPGDRRAAGHVRRPGLPREPDQLGHRRRLAGVGVQAVRPRRGHRGRLSPERAPSRATRPTSSPTAGQGRQRGSRRRQRLRRRDHA